MKTILIVVGAIVALAVIYFVVAILLAVKKMNK